MKKKNGSRGAISVFLAMILVPCIVVSSLFVDLSRVHLSKTTAESSADLALNALLTNYDADLKDWYGMVASCQNIEEFYQVSANYFIRTLKSQGMSDAEIILLSDYYANATNDDTIYDLLKVECNTQPGAMISAVDGANLSNAALIKEQVVEFMKYRAPIEITTNLVERFKSDSTVMQAIEAEENEPLVEDKQEFFESEGKLTEAAFYSYQAIRAYYVEANTKGLTNASLSEEYSKFGNYQNVYREILGYVISNLTNTSGLSRYNRYTISKTYYNDYYSNPTKRFSDVYSEKKKVDGVDTYYIDLDDVKDLVDDLAEKKQDFLTAKSNFESAAQPILNKLPYGTGESQTNPIQWWVQMNNAVNASSGTNHTSKVSSAAKAMMQAYSKVLAIDECELRGDLPEDWDSLSDWKDEYGATTLISSVESLHYTYLSAGRTNNSDTYLKAVSNLESVSSSQYGNISASNLYVTVDGQRKNLNSAISYISSDLASTRAEMQAYVDLLDVAIDGDDGDTPSLTELKSYVTTYEQKLGDWTSTAGNTNTTMGDADTQEINGMSASIEIDTDDVDTLKTRLTRIRSQVQGLIDDIDSLKWGGTAIKDITSLDTFKSKVSIDKSRIGTTNSDIKSYRDSLFSQKFTPQTLPTLDHTSDNTYNPVIDPLTGDVATPDLWVYLYSKYRGAESGMETAKEEKETAQETATQKANEAKDKDRYNGGGQNVKWTYSDNTSFNLGESFTGVIGVVEDLINLDFTGMRDDLYATTYIMEMFSYATFENEGLYQLVKKSDPSKVTELTTSNYTTYYNNVMGADANAEGTWLSDNPKDHYNKSLTNHLINKTNNAAYGAEIEYILCGSNGSTNSDNVKSVYNKIYTIRYGLNVVSSFQHFWNPAGTNTDPTAMALFFAASGVQALTAGIVPIAVTEAVLLPILTIFETSKDLDRLERGFPVELYKTEPGQWWVSLTPQSPDDEATPSMPGGISAFLSLISGEGLARHNTDNGLFYSDYLTLYVYLGLNSSAQQGMYQRMAEVIQFNIGTMANSTSYSLANSRLYFQLNAELRVKPLMIALPFFSNDEYSNELDTKTDWCTYKISTTRGY